MNTVSFSLDQIISNEYQDASDDSPLMMLSEAEIILGQDAETHKVLIVDGKEVLHDIVQDANHEPVSVVVVQLNHQGDDIRQLRNIIDLAKSRS